MLTPKVSQPTDVGVVVARFQVDDLHAGHIELLDTVRSLHKKVVVVIGVSATQTRSNPLDFKPREFMLRERYPDVSIVALKDDRSDVVWSRNLDRKIREIYELESVTIYGSRDSFIPRYFGGFPVVELDATKKVRGADVRKYVANDVRPSRDYRRGMIAAVWGRHPIAYTCVDAAVVNFDTQQILLARKNSDDEGWYRFFGGFFDTGVDVSLESAVSREVQEEAGGIGIGSPQYVGSARIDDWRYRGERDAIVSSLFIVPYVFGQPRAGDDVDAARWFGLDADFSKILVQEHQGLGQLLKSHLNRVTNINEGAST